MITQSKKRLSRADADRQLVLHGIRDGRYAEEVGIRLLIESGLSKDEALACCKSVSADAFELLSRSSVLPHTPDLLG